MDDDNEEDDANDDGDDCVMRKGMVNQLISIHVVDAPAAKLSRQPWQGGHFFQSRIAC